MRFPFRFRHDDEPLRIPVPEILEACCTVYFRSDKPPMEADGRGSEAAISAWIEGHCDGALRTEIQSFVDRRGLRIECRGEEKRSGALEASWSFPGEEEHRRFEWANQVAVVAGASSWGPPWTGYWSVTAGSRAIAEALGGAILEARYPGPLPIATHEARLPSDGRIHVADHIQVLQSVDKAGSLWTTSKGLSKFGLPELELTDGPQHLSGRIAHLVNGAAQRLFNLIADGAIVSEGGSLRVDPEIEVSPDDMQDACGADERFEPPAGVPGRAKVRLQYRPSRRGDSFLSLVPPKGLGKKQAAWVHSVFEDLFGGQDTLQVLKADEALEAAHRRAREELPRVKSRFLQGLFRGATLFVKYGLLVEGGGVEYVWLSVGSWRGETLSGHLVNQPQWALGLKADDRIELREGDVYDWMIQLRDGTWEGGYTERVVRGEGG